MLYKFCEKLSIVSGGWKVTPLTFSGMDTESGLLPDVTPCIPSSDQKSICLVCFWGLAFRSGNQYLLMKDICQLLGMNTIHTVPSPVRWGGIAIQLRPCYRFCHSVGSASLCRGIQLARSLLLDKIPNPI